MKKLFLIPFIIVLSVGLIFGGCAEPEPTPTPAPSTPTPAPTPTPAEPITLKLGWDAPPMEAFAQGTQLWADAVTERTEGRVMFEMYPSGSLSADRRCIDALAAGLADAYILSIRQFSEYFPLSQIPSLPGIAGDFPETEEGKLDYLSAYWSFINEYPAVADEWKDFHRIGMLPIGTNCFESRNKEIRSLEDLDGLKFGSSSEVFSDIVEKYGAVPIPGGTPPMAYQRMQTGLTDASAGPRDTIATFELWEVLEYVNDFAVGGDAWMLVFNNDAWNKISARDQQIMSDAFPEGKELATELLMSLTEKAKQGFIDYRGEDAWIIPTPAERENFEEAFMAHYYDVWIPEQKAAGITNIEEMFNGWMSIRDKALEKYEK